jgi:heme/copper-type cytochrome/quinol oxidase subunit 3
MASKTSLRDEMSVTTVGREGELDRGVAGMPVGRIGMWWFLAGEIMVFGGLIVSYVLSRIAAGGWEAETAHVNTRLAAVNTLVLLTSSLTMVEAHGAIGSGNRVRARKFLLLTVLLGSAFLGVKAYEYSLEIRNGFFPSSGLFWSFYYAMTGLHGLHVLVGIGVNFALFVSAGRPWFGGIQQRVEYAGLYWHFVDVVWIFLFPLLYLA